MISLRSILNSRTSWVFASLVAARGVASLYAFEQPRVHEAECMLTFYWPRTYQAHESSSPDETRLNRVQTVIEKTHENIAAVLARLTSYDRSLILGFVEKPSDAEMKQLVSLVNRHLSVRVDSEAMTATITYRHRDQAAAFLLMKSVVDDCLERERVSRLAPIDGLLFLEAALTKELTALSREKAALPKDAPSSASVDLDRIISGHRARLDLIPVRIDQLRHSEPEIRIATTPRITGSYVDWRTIIRGFWPTLIFANLVALISSVVARRSFVRRATSSPLNQPTRK